MSHDLQTVPSPSTVQHAAMPRVAMIMPVYNEREHLPDVLASIAAQSFDHRRLFLIAVDGGSGDGSGEILRSWIANGDIAGVVLTNDRRSIPRSLNLALAQASCDDIIVRLDAHTVYGPRYVEDVVAALERAPADVGAVGGAQTPESPQSFGAAVIAALMTNPLGLGGGDFRRPGTVRYVDSAYLGAWKPGVVQSVGGFDERWRANEDSELAARLRDAGYRMWWVPLESRYRINRTLLATLRQWARYGYWRAQTVRRHRRTLRTRHLAPVAATLSACVLAATPIRWTLVPLYAIYVAALVKNRAPGESPAVTAACCLFFPAAQSSFAAGFCAGYLRSLVAGAP